MAFGFFANPSLTTPLNSGAPLALGLDISSGTPVDTVIYFGSSTSGVKVVDAASPGVAQIAVSVVDAASGSGEPDSAIKLATSAGGLDTAVGGAALNIGATVLGGVANAVAIHLRFTDATSAVGLYTDLALSTSLLTEQPV